MKLKGNGVYMEEPCLSIHLRLKINSRVSCNSSVKKVEPAEYYNSLMLNVDIKVLEGE